MHVLRWVIDESSAVVYNLYKLVVDDHAYICWNWFDLPLNLPWSTATVFKFSLKLVWFAFEHSFDNNYIFDFLLKTCLICLRTCLGIQFDLDISLKNMHYQRNFMLVQNETFTEECLWLFLCLLIYLNITTESELYKFVFSWEKILLIKNHNEHDKIMY